MNVKSVALQAYQNAVDNKKSLETQIRSKVRQGEDDAQGFGDTLMESLGKVNELETQKHQMIEEFASGKSDNVHELMITMQKAGLAMSMTSAVRTKIMTAYQELMRMSF
jgi:flagellar hook-basal body complex protein FliE